MKKIIFSLLISASALSASAQKFNNVKFSVGGELGIPTGNFSTVYSAAIGGTAQVDYMITEDAALTANTGIIEFLGKNIKGTNLKYQSAGLIPLLAGVQYYFIPKVYGSAQLGATFSTQSSGGTSFTYAPGIGYKISDKIDALLKYTGYSGNGGAVGIRLGFTF